MRTAMPSRCLLREHETVIEPVTLPIPVAAPQLASIGLEPLVGIDNRLRSLDLLDDLVSLGLCPAHEVVKLVRQGHGDGVRCKLMTIRGISDAMGEVSERQPGQKKEDEDLPDTHGVRMTTRSGRVLRVASNLELDDATQLVLNIAPHRGSISKHRKRDIKLRLRAA
jgi:hypothetical protein